MLSVVSHPAPYVKLIPIYQCTAPPPYQAFCKLNNFTIDLGGRGQRGSQDAAGHPFPRATLPLHPPASDLLIPGGAHAPETRLPKWSNQGIFQTKAA